MRPCGRLRGVRRPYPDDLRERLLQAMDAGLAAAEVARAFGISARSLRRWRQWARERGTVAAKPRPGRPARIAPERWPALRAQVAAHPDATLAEHCARWAEATGVGVSPATMSRLLARLGLPLKKRP
jgi:transposase